MNKHAQFPGLKENEVVCGDSMRNYLLFSFNVPFLSNKKESIITPNKCSCHNLVATLKKFASIYILVRERPNNFKCVISYQPFPVQILISLKKAKIRKISVFVVKTFILLN